MKADRPVVEIILPKSKRAKKGMRPAVKFFLLLLVLIGVSLITYSVFAYKKQVKSPEATPTPTPVAVSASPTATPIPTSERLLDGVKVNSGREALKPLAVMIENHPEARPQSGLSSANVVIEAIAEGGITRFEAIFADTESGVKIGPIRSARTYYVNWANEFKAMYAHVGGSESGLALIKSLGVADLNQFGIGEPTFKRDYSRNVATEHTMYSTTDALWNYGVNSYKYSNKADFSPWLFKDGLAEDKRPATSEVSISVSTAEYDVMWSYDSKTNQYARKMAGSAHVDANTNQQITTDNIITQQVTRTPQPGEKGWIYNTSGSGSCNLYQDGTKIACTWKKVDGRTRYFDMTDKELALNRGKIWIHLTHDDTIIK